MCVFLLLGRLSLQFCMAFHKDRSSDRSCSCYILLTCCSLSDDIIFIRTPMLTTPRSTQQLSTCVDEVARWMMSNWLQLNHSKTEVLWCASSRRQHQLPTGPVRIGNTSVMPVTAIRDLGVHLNADLTMTAHVTATARACFAALRQIWSVKNSLTLDALLTLIRALVCNIGTWWYVVYEELAL